jgi:ArsR family transcriptional regulator
MCTECYKLAAERTRHEILSMLKRNGPMTVSMLTDRLAVKQPTVTHHLKLMREAKLVRMQTRGREHVFALSMASECFSECGLLSGL